MKTIREVCEKTYYDRREDLVRDLEDRERERDEKERERVLAAVEQWRNGPIGNRIESIIYPPTKPEMLPAGWYWWKWKRDTSEFDWHCEYLPDMAKRDDWDFRPWHDPPPEVTGKVELSAMEKSCCEKNANYHACDCPKRASPSER